LTLSAADRLDILDVVSRADAAATRRDADAYASLFTDDAVLDGSGVVTSGRRGCVPQSARSGLPKGRPRCT
jgi:hypothetical protein